MIDTFRINTVLGQIIRRVEFIEDEGVPEEIKARYRNQYISDISADLKILLAEIKSIEENSVINPS